MGCYCQSSYASDPIGSINLQFTDIDKADKKYYCYDWLLSIFYQSFLLYGGAVMVAIINIIATNIFECTSFLIGGHTVVEETFTKFRNILIMMFINTSVVIVLVNFNIYGTSSEQA
jgi:hypothetical protein